MNYTNISKGSIYELQSQNGNTNGNLYLCISDNTYQANTNNCIVCLVKEDDYRNTSSYMVPFVMKHINRNIDMVIFPEVCFNVNSNRLCRYKFTLTDDIMHKVDESIMRLMFGKSMYTLDEAIVKLHNIEMDKRIEYQYKENNPDKDIDTIDTTNDTMEYVDVSDIGIEDSQVMFAKSMMKDKRLVNLNISSNNTTEKTEEVTIIKKTNKSKTTSKTVIHNDYSYIYDHYEDFLMDYYSGDFEFVAQKWKIPVKSLGNRAYRCRQISIRNNDDQSIWNEFSKELITRSRNKKKNKCI